MIFSPPEGGPSSPLKAMMLGRRSFPIGKVTFQGRTVKLREGKCQFKIRSGSEVTKKVGHTIDMSTSRLHTVVFPTQTSNFVMVCSTPTWGDLGGIPC